MVETKTRGSAETDNDSVQFSLERLTKAISFTVYCFGLVVGILIVCACKRVDQIAKGELTCPS